MGPRSKGGKKSRLPGVAGLIPWVPTASSAAARPLLRSVGLCPIGRVGRLDTETILVDKMVTGALTSIIMADSTKHVTINEQVAAVIGKQDKDTRIFRAEGDSDAFMHWWDVLSEHLPRGLVSPGGACPYAGVSRAAIHKAMREGRLTVFAFHKHEEKRGIFGSKLVRENPYMYLPIVELKAWRVELEERVGKLRATGATLIKIRKMLQRELEGAKPDWDAFFASDHPEGRVIRKKEKGG